MRQPIAQVMIRAGISYNREAFVAGLGRLGYEIQMVVIPNTNGMQGGTIRPDILVTWNRSREREPSIAQFQAKGGAVVVAENGYIGFDDEGDKLYALSLYHHNGAGKWTVGDGSRWEKLRRTSNYRPWLRGRGDRVVVLPQRGFGEPGVAMPRQWPHSIQSLLAKITDRPVFIKPHPGARATYHDPWEGIKDAHCCVTWASGAGIKALALGVPVFHQLPTWIGAGAARRINPELAEPGCLEDPFMENREPMFRRLAWAQWSAAEIATGEAFETLMHSHSTRVEGPFDGNAHVQELSSQR